MEKPIEVKKDKSKDSGEKGIEAAQTVCCIKPSAAPQITTPTSTKQTTLHHIELPPKKIRPEQLRPLEQGLSLVADGFKKFHPKFNGEENANNAETHGKSDGNHAKSISFDSFNSGLKRSLNSTCFSEHKFYSPFLTRRIAEYIAMANSDDNT